MRKIIFVLAIIFALCVPMAAENDIEITYERAVYFEGLDPFVIVEQRIQEASAEFSVIIRGEFAFSHEGIYDSGTVLKGNYLAIDILCDTGTRSIFYDIKRKKTILDTDERLSRFRVRGNTIKLFSEEKTYEYNCRKKRGILRKTTLAEYKISYIGKKLYSMNEGNIIEKKSNKERIIGENFAYFDSDKHLIAVRYDKDKNSNTVYLYKNGQFEQICKYDFDILADTKSDYIIIIRENGFDVFSINDDRFLSIEESEVIRMVQKGVYYFKKEGIHFLKFQDYSEITVNYCYKKGSVRMKKYNTENIFICQHTGICLLKLYDKVYFLGQAEIYPMECNYPTLSRVFSINEIAIAEVDFEELAENIIARIRMRSPLDFYYQYDLEEMDGYQLDREYYFNVY